MRRAPWSICLLAALPLMANCSTSGDALPRPVRQLLEHAAGQRWMTTGRDPWAVVVCHVPAGATSMFYAGLPLRRDFTAEQLTAIVQDKVPAYFRAISHGRYEPVFSPAGAVTIGVHDDPQACVDAAITKSPTDARGVLVIADAEHPASQPGGFGSAGDGCTAACPARQSRRYAYVGAADFSTEWGSRPPMDLIEHELGHALGWPHSGTDPSAAEPHESALDVMSNSAAPRDTDPDRRDAPDTLAINRLAAGWLPTSAVVVASAAGTTTTLSPSTGSSGTRLVIVALDSDRFLTVELLPAEGFDDHLPASGIAVHLIDMSTSPRTQTPLVGSPPFTDLLTEGETFTGHGWRIAVSAGWRVAIDPMGTAPTVGT